MPTITHIAETVLYVDDLERAVNFYTSLFQYFRDPDHHAVELSTPGLWQ